MFFIPNMLASFFADLYGGGKMGIVVLTILLIFCGLFFYLWLLYIKSWRLEARAKEGEEKPSEQKKTPQKKVTGA